MILEREPELLKQFLEFIPTIKKPGTRPVRNREGSQRDSVSNGIDAIAVTQGPGLDPALWAWLYRFARRCNHHDMMEAGRAIQALLNSSRRLYDELLKDSKVTTPKIDPRNRSIYNQYCVRVPNRDAVKQTLADRGIGTAVYYPIPLHLQECFAYLRHNQGDFRESMVACKRDLTRRDRRARARNDNHLI